MDEESEQIEEGEESGEELDGENRDGEKHEKCLGEVWVKEDEEQYNLAGEGADEMWGLVQGEKLKAGVRGEGEEDQLDDYQVLVSVNETWDEKWVDEDAEGYQDDSQVLELVSAILDVGRD